MTATTSPQSTDHMIQICRERSARGVATRSDWERLAEMSPDRARRELITFLDLNQDPQTSNPYSNNQPHRGLVTGFIFGMLFMAGWWFFADFLNREVVTSGKQWDLVTLTQYIAASLLPVFAWLGWRWDKNRAVEEEARPQEVRLNYAEATWDELLDQFDHTRKAGGTRMY